MSASATTGVKALRDMADVALRIARQSLAQTKFAGLIIVLGFPDGSTKQVPTEITAKLAPMLSDGDAKTRLFGTVRQYAQRTGAVSVVFGTEAWVGKSTPKALALSEEEFKGLVDTGFEKLMSMGLVEREEAVVATAQDADAVVVATQTFRRLGNGEPYSYGEVDVKDFPQSDFRGRQKMFGDLREENLS